MQVDVAHGLKPLLKRSPERIFIFQRPVLEYYLNEYATGRF
jgi:hypothetical protein